MNERRKIFHMLKRDRIGTVEKYSKRRKRKKKLIWCKRCEDMKDYFYGSKILGN